ncbi:MAG: rhodanese-like domain-containing protein [Bacilli bacterium]
MNSDITVKKLKELISTNIQIIDIRSEEDFKHGFIPNALNISLYQLRLFPEHYLNKNSVYYLYCNEGDKSDNLCRELTEKGYKVINIIGGYRKWIIDN